MLALRRGTEAARIFRRNGWSHVTVDRCRHCRRVYTLCSGTVFLGKHLRLAQVIFLLRGIGTGESSAVLAKELGLSRTAVSYVSTRDSAKRAADAAGDSAGG